MNQKIYETYNTAETFAIGKSIGEEAKSGDVIALNGDLGCGKTIIAQGIAAGLGITGIVNSPTFILLNEYENGRLPLYHFDVYRINDVREMDETGFHEYVYGDGLTLIEWANLIEEILPAQYLQVEIKKDPEKGFAYRQIKVRHKVSQ